MLLRDLPDLSDLDPLRFCGRPLIDLTDTKVVQHVDPPKSSPDVSPFFLFSGRCIDDG